MEVQDTCASTTLTLLTRPRLVYTPLLVGITNGSAKLGDNPSFIPPREIAERMKDLVELEKYPGGTALGVHRPGDATVVADGLNSELEELAPSDLDNIRKILASDRKET